MPVGRDAALIPHLGMMQTARWQRLIPFALALSIAVAAVAPIRSYDLFWHLATGRWIVDHGRLPGTDPFGVASDQHPWINGEWLFQLTVFGAHELGGLNGLSIARGLFAAMLFLLVFLAARGRRNGSSEEHREQPHAALLLTTVAFAGASPLLDVRPASAAMIFVVAALMLRSPISHGVLSFVWINAHPSALLAPILAGLTTRRILPVVASVAGLLINPYGIRALTAPLELMAYVRSGEFVNVEWLPSPPQLFPLLYACVLLGGGALVYAWRRGSEGSSLERLSRLALFLLFSYLAVRHVRNQVLFFAVFPILITPAIRPSLMPRRIALFASAAVVSLIALTGDHRLGITADRFPIDATARLSDTQLAGNLYNPDQFGGFLIWSFYPERRVLTDGRNELYRTFIPESHAARGDQRRWRELLTRYRIDLAVEEYAPPLEVRDGVTGAMATMPASLAYWPRDQWALIGFDAAAMVFARRSAFPAEVIARWEISGVIPDDPRIRNSASVRR